MFYIQYEINLHDTEKKLKVDKELDIKLVEDIHLRLGGSFEYLATRWISDNRVHLRYE